MHCPFVVYKDMKEAMQKHPEVDVMVNFASLRSAYDSTIQALNFDQVSYSITVVLVHSICIHYQYLHICNIRYAPLFSKVFSV